MGNSSITIDFITVPNIGQSISFSEQKSGLTFNEIFKSSRVNSYEIGIATYQAHILEWLSSSSTKYKIGFDIDYNAGNLFTVVDTHNSIINGLGKVTITANYPDAVFYVNNAPECISVSISNQATTTPPVVIPPIAVETFTPAKIDFVHNQNQFLDSKSISINMTNFKIGGKPNYVLSSPTASVIIATITDSSGTYQIAQGSGIATIIITPTVFYDNENFIASDLSGIFNVFSNDIIVGSVAWTMIVNKLSDFLTNPVPSGQKSFTLDPLFFVFNSSNTNAYFQFDTTIKTFDFFNNIPNEKIIFEKIVLFKNTSKINIGQVIHRLMRKFETVNDRLLQYKLACVKITCTEKSIIDNSIIRSASSSDIPFVAGLSLGVTNFGFLDINPKPNRVTINSFAYLNILIPEGNYELRTLKNGRLINSEALPASTGIVFSKKVSFSNYTLGDSIFFIIDVIGQNNPTAPTKIYQVFPEGKHSNMIVWENEFLLQSAIECTGTMSIIPEGEFISQTILNNLVEHLEHLSSTKTVKLNINTGWLAYTDIDTVESLMRSKRAWLIQADKIIDLRPIGKKLPEKDLETELIQYPLEFKINQKYNEETYSL